MARRRKGGAGALLLIAAGVGLIALPNNLTRIFFAILLVFFLDRFLHADHMRRHEEVGDRILRQQLSRIPSCLLDTRPQAAEATGRTLLVRYPNGTHQSMAP
jgi:hypothetical protein